MLLDAYYQIKECKDQARCGCYCNVSGDLDEWLLLNALVGTLSWMNSTMKRVSPPEDISEKLLEKDKSLIKNQIRNVCR